MQSPPPSSQAELINSPGEPLSVHLYSVQSVEVDPGANLDQLSTHWDQTLLTIDLTQDQAGEQDFGIAGFQHSNIAFKTKESKVELQQLSEFQEVFHGLRQAVLGRAKQMSLGLGLCVFILVLGVGAMLLAVIKRHQLLIESVVYSSIGSLRRIKDKTSVQQKEIIVSNKKEPASEVTKKQPSNEITTTTQVDFFPRYSLVNKSQRGAPRLLNEKKSMEGIHSGKVATFQKKKQIKQ